MNYFKSLLILVLIILLGLIAKASFARNNIRSAFFDVYPDAEVTTIGTVPSQSDHCGVCHYEFTGGGPRNPYGVLLESVLPNFSSNPNGRRSAVSSIENDDPDGDGFSTLVEVTDVSTYVNTPTFPGLTPALLSNVTSVDPAEIQSHLVPSTGSDTTPPDVSVIVPDGGENLLANSVATVQWIAGDASGIASVNLYISDDNGLTFKLFAKGLQNTGTYNWFPANRPTTQAIVKVEAIDNAFNAGSDQSDGVFTISSPPGGIVPTTLRDFDQPGSQPFESGVLNPPEACAVCHGNYDTTVEPYHNWQGSMMSQASLDPIFLANMSIANQDAPESGDLCLRCHFPRGWLQGRSVPTDGSQMLDADKRGVSCDFCHRLVDPIFDPAANPPEDEQILNDLSNPATVFANGMATVDPVGTRRGPFVNANSGHPVLVSPFHREAALCGTCHDVSNPAFEKDGNGNYVPNALDAAANDFSSHMLMPVERTYSEWFNSDYNTPAGVYAPQFGGNQDYVATCQDCHMPDVTGQGCNMNPPIRDDLPLHDMTGGSAWLGGLMNTLYPTQTNPAALQDSVNRSLYMIANAAEVTLNQENGHLKVHVVNNTGHKLPTGYPEGRRMWINVKFYDDSMTLLLESGAYDFATGELAHGPDDKIYEIEPGMDESIAALAGEPNGPSLHFVLNNKVFFDNRIPPRGFTNAAFDSFGGSPVGHNYEDGQFWDDTYYEIPPFATTAEVTLYYQSTSKEFIEFLRDHNTTDTKGQEVYNLWNTNDKCPPEIMANEQLSVTPPQQPGDFDGDYDVDLIDLYRFSLRWGNTGCAGPDTCDGANFFDADDRINNKDYAIFAQYWMDSL